MNCSEVSSFLDEDGLRVPSGAQAVAARRHAAGCDACNAALVAMQALGADPVPAFGAARLTVTGGAITRASGAAAPARLRQAAVVGLSLAACAAAAWILTVDLRSGSGPAPAARSPSVEIAAPVPGDTVEAVTEWMAAELAADDAAFEATLATQPQPSGEYFALLKRPPRYPAEAAAAGLEGTVVLEFTITALGDVADIAVIEASDPLFGPPSVEVARTFKYKPRIVDGEPVEVRGIRNRIVYRLSVPAESAASVAEQDAAREGPTDAPTADWTTVAPAFESAYTCLRRQDLRCAELTLDELTAVHRLGPETATLAWQMYGFIYFRGGNPERAIEAYERAAATATGAARATPLRTIARIHFERQRYQAALDAQLEALRSMDRRSPDDHAFVDRLIALGAEQP